jgi:hypothetical protein
MIMRRPAALTALALALVLGGSSLGCGHPPNAAAPRAARIATPTAAPEPAPGPVVPVPETLQLVAGQFGLTMQAEGFTWKVLRRNVTRFDWEGRPSSAKVGAPADRELLYSFYIEKLDDSSAKLLPQIVASAAANLAEGEPCKPREEPAGVVQALGVDRVISVCFEPSTFYGKEHPMGVLHGLVKNGALTIVVVLADERTKLLPLPSVLGVHGAR